jgi:CheY-like chemotaxis protein
MRVKKVVGLKVLIADDEKLNRVMVSKLITKYGSDCDMAENGLKALEMVMESDYDVVFLDYNMPGQSGHECAEKIREMYASADHRRPYLVCVSADDEHSSNGVFDAFLAKPFRIDDMYSILDAVNAGGEA